MSKKRSIFDINMAYKNLSRTTAKELKSLTTKKGRDNSGLFMAEGEKCVSDLLGHFTPEFLIASPQWVELHPETADKEKDKIYLTDKRGIEIISSLQSLPEVIGVFKKPSDNSVMPKLDSRKLYLLLDEIQDPGNLGTIVRTCDWFGVYDIYASPTTADVWSPKVVQATMGSLSRVKVHYTNLSALIEMNKEMTVIGTLLEGESLYSSNLNGSGGLLIMGNEGRGISEELRQKIDIAVTIPPHNEASHPDSLNVGVATAVMLSYIRGGIETVK